jgi:hypothetical protein
MRVKVDLAALKKDRWNELALRFAFGGAITVVTGFLAKKFGPEFGGLFLAFPAIFPAAATLIEKHERERKVKAGIAAPLRGRRAAALDARGAAIGSLGLICFAVVVWKALAAWGIAFTLSAATLAWLAVSILFWMFRRPLPLGRIPPAHSR